MGRNCKCGAKRIGAKRRKEKKRRKRLAHRANREKEFGPITFNEP